MKYLAIRHTLEQTKRWWFFCPKRMEHMVSIGARVLCNTSQGETIGQIMSIMDSVPQSEAELIIGRRFPLKPIFGVEVNMKMDKIHIPLRFFLSSPDPAEIAKRMQEWYLSSKFQDTVLFAPDGTLQDGYTAYLVAKMFGHETLRGFCLELDKENEDGLCNG